MNDRAAPIHATLSTDGDPASAAGEFADRVEQGYPLPASLVTNLRIALDEVVTNIVKYAYPQGGSHEFTLRSELAADGLMTVIEDDGVPFDPLGAPPPDLTVPLEERKAGGLGILFVRNLMSAVVYERIGERNRLTLKQVMTQESAKS